jgi:hypothetical protein
MLAMGAVGDAHAGQRIDLLRHLRSPGLPGTCCRFCLSFLPEPVAAR